LFTVDLNSEENS